MRSIRNGYLEMTLTFEFHIFSYHNFVSGYMQKSLWSDNIYWFLSFFFISRQNVTSDLQNNQAIPITCTIFTYLKNQARYFPIAPPPGIFFYQRKKCKLRPQDEISAHNGVDKKHYFLTHSCFYHLSCLVCPSHPSLWSCQYDCHLKHYTLQDPAP